MAVLYDLNAYRAPRLLNMFAQQTGDVARMMNVQSIRLQKLEDGLTEMVEALGQTRSTLDKAEGLLEEAQELHEASLEALDTGNVEVMVRARDEIEQYRHAMRKRLLTERVS